MPPFMGQGLCSGVRDAASLAWRLDLVLRGVAGDELLDGYTTERRPQNEWIVNLSTEMGRVSCTLDPRPPPSATPRCALPTRRRRWRCRRSGTGRSRRSAAGRHRAVQGLVRLGGREGRFDDVVGKGFVLLTRRAADLPPAQAEAFSSASGARVVALDELEDLDGRLTAWLDEHGVGRCWSARRLRLRRRRGARGPPALVDDLRSPVHHRLEDHRPCPLTAVIHPKFHHVNFKTTRLQEMIDWYGALLGTEVLFQNPFGAWISNDEANHRIALTAFPNFVDDPEKDTRTGLHHTAFEYAGFEELNASYLRLKEAGIVPAFCLDHGMTFSYYYRDPDGNHVELQVDNFGDWAKSSAYMRESPRVPRGPDRQVRRPQPRGRGLPRRARALAMAGEFAPTPAARRRQQVGEVVVGSPAPRRGSGRRWRARSPTTTRA